MSETIQKIKHIEVNNKTVFTKITQTKINMRKLNCKNINQSPLPKAFLQIGKQETTHSIEISSTQQTKMAHINCKTLELSHYYFLPVSCLPIFLLMHCMLTFELT